VLTSSAPHDGMRMIFHHPLPVRSGAASASGIRPYEMIEAFRSLGYEVEEVCGYSSDRARAIAEVDRKLRQGVRFAFMYGESSTEPTILTDRHHLPLRPLLDFAFFARLKSAGIPRGVFYRDIYWRFPGYGASLPWWKAAAARLCYRYDLIQYRRLLDKLFLPSLAMASHVPWVGASRMSALPPGFIDRAVARHPAPALRLLYVGGLGEHYQMHELFRALDAVPGAELTVCTREAEWQAVRHEYQLPAAGNVRIVHGAGAQLTDLFANADVCMLCVKPQPYREFAAPVKLYEYVGVQRPVVASRGTWSADFVESNGIGWTVPYEASEIAALLRRLLGDRSLVDEKIVNLGRIRHQHTWQARARQVVSELAGAQRQ
jgi:glycosyltransferase involved in cell wall biosynthesis